ncbi:Lrp/AsnC family transcriptional regulator [Cytobacillus spongiae]|jgi:DNA-binding Lrp family transcriptional regulator|uniref:Lrp/AsnC family transcriptional regulator n=1 Tax=Cytobacillus spongiae TaxID=2901381 RepID=UPI001F1D995D|nr:Lrp/AsnC family transcriptional regulator [Cytobacillus spongiae]UII55526.1 Lrp/AsnC family transcriptional regulator [Cytobacillus spongiae]
MESIVSRVLDHVDIQILDWLQKDGQLSNLEISKRVKLSAPAVHARIKRLESDGYIKNQVAILNHEKLGFDLLCFVFMSTNVHEAEKLSSLEKSLYSMKEVMECHCLTGEYDYLLKVACRDRKGLEEFIRRLNEIGVTKIQTSLALREIKDSTFLPILED